MTVEISPEIAAERERFRRLFLVYAHDTHGWKMKDESADDVRAMLEDIDSGAQAVARLKFCSADPNNHGLPSIVHDEAEPAQ